MLYQSPIFVIFFNYIVHGATGGVVRKKGPQFFFFFFFV